MLELKGKITIGRPQCSDGREVITIDVQDNSSRCRIVNLEMTYENFTKALTGQGYIDCDIDFNDSELIGKKKEHKTVKVPRMKGYERVNNKEIETHMVAYDNINQLFLDGWVPRYEDFNNHHKHTDDNHVMVIFERWV